MADLGGAGLRVFTTTGLSGAFTTFETLFLGVITTTGSATDSSSSEVFFLLRLALVAASCSSLSLARFFSVGAFTLVERRFVGGDGSGTVSVLRLGAIFLN